MEKNITLGLRSRLIEELNLYFQKRGYTNYDYVLDAIRQTPRHQFVPIGFEQLAYTLNPVLIDSEQTMSSPLTVALQTYFLQVSRQSKVLEIGTGSGYQATVLSHICAEIHTLERHHILYEKSKSIFKELQRTQIKSYLKDGFEGLPIHAPFDRILITCGAPEIPQNLVEQLSIGGIMLVPLDNEDGSQTMIRLIKTDVHSIYTESLGIYNFVPMLKGLE